MSERRPGVIFDGDDTLWATQPIYDRVKQEFSDLLSKVGIDAERAVTKLDRIDAENVRRYGVTLVRFRHSLVETYRVLASETALPRLPEIEHKIETLTKLLIQLLPEPVPGAREVIRDLSTDFHVVLYTVGDPDVQLARLESVGLRELFADGDIVIVKRKSVNRLRCLLTEQDLPKSRTWLVGNSIRSDINPALKIGIRAIWVRTKTWLYEEEEPYSNAFIIVDSIEEVPGIIRREVN